MAVQITCRNRVLGDLENVLAVWAFEEALRRLWWGLEHSLYILCFCQVPSTEERKGTRE